MTFNFDTASLTQTIARRITPHDNCVVTELGSGAFPRYIKLQLPDDDGPQQVALWDGSLDLEVNDEVYCHEYAEIPIWRIMAMGGADSGAGKVRVSKVWESDFGAVALETDASGNVTINGTRTLTIPTDMIHAGDADTKWSFTDDKITLTAGSLALLTLTETTQNLVEIGNATDTDVNVNNGQVFVRGSDGRFGVGTGGTVDAVIHAKSSGPEFKLEATSTADVPQMSFYDPSGLGALFQWRGTTASPANLFRFGTFQAGGEMGFFANSLDEAMRIDSSLNVGIGTTSPSTRLHTTDEDAVTATTTDIATLGHNSTGTPIAANFGAGLLYQLESTTSEDQDAARIAALWTTPTHGSRASALVFQTLTAAGSLTEQVRIAGDGVITSVSGRIKNTTRITDVDSPYAVLATDEIIVADTDGGAITVNLPAGVDGTHYRITNVGTAANDVTIDPNGSEQLFGAGAGVSFALIDAETINIYFETTEGWW